MHVDAFAVGRFDEAEHLDVLVERQRDVEVIDALLPDDLVGFGERAEQRQARGSRCGRRRPIVEEADDLEPELAVLEDLVGDEPPEIAGAGDEHALEPDAGAPPALERLAHQLARRIGEDDVEDEEERARPAARPRRPPGPALGGSGA